MALIFYLLLISTVIKQNLGQQSIALYPASYPVSYPGNIEISSVIDGNKINSICSYESLQNKTRDIQVYRTEFKFSIEFESNHLHFKSQRFQNNTKKVNFQHTVKRDIHGAKLTCNILFFTRDMILHYKTKSILNNVPATTVSDIDTTVSREITLFKLNYTILKINDNFGQLLINPNTSQTTTVSDISVCYSPYAIFVMFKLYNYICEKNCYNNRHNILECALDICDVHCPLLYDIDYVFKITNGHGISLSEDVHIPIPN